MWKSFIALNLLALVAESASAAAPSNCLPTGNGYLRARVGGALNLDIDWPNTGLECEGSPRPDGSGIRLSFAGPVGSDGRRVRMVFGMAASVKASRAMAFPRTSP